MASFSDEGLALNVCSEPFEAMDLLKINSLRMRRGRLDLGKELVLLASNYKTFYMTEWMHITLVAMSLKVLYIVGDQQGLHNQVQYHGK